MQAQGLCIRQLANIIMTVHTAIITLVHIKPWTASLYCNTVKPLAAIILITGHRY